MKTEHIFIQESVDVISRRSREIPVLRHGFLTMFEMTRDKNYFTSELLHGSSRYHEKVLVIDAKNTHWAKDHRDSPIHEQKRSLG